MERTPLGAKPVNLFGRNKSRSPLKRASPTKLTTTSPIKKQRSYSPKKRDAKAFNIFRDDQCYRQSGASPVGKLGLTPQLQKFSLDDSNKENINDKIQPKREYQRSMCSSRVLNDLSITDFPGYITSPSSEALKPKIQLREPWYSNKFSNKQECQKMNVPSFVTPPKKDRIKHYIFVDSLNNTKATTGLHSCDDLELNSGNVNRKLDFIYNDQLKF